jgi:hypothetical protein
MPRRDEVVKAANRCATESRGGARAPYLTATSPREAVLRWLQWNDPNGCYLDELCEPEFGDPLSEEDAWRLLDECMVESEEIDPA